MCLFELEFCSGLCPGVGFLDRTVALVLLFQGDSILFSIMAAPIYIPSSSVGDSLQGSFLVSYVLWGLTNV